MIAYQYDSETKKYIGEIERQLDPLESLAQRKDIYLMPADSTDIHPLEPKEGYDIIFNGTDWEYKEIEKESEPYTSTEKEIKQSRIIELKYLLDSKEYWTSKYIDGEYTEEEWAEKLAMRKAWRAEINQLESELETMKD